MPDWRRFGCGFMIGVVIMLVIVAILSVLGFLASGMGR